jgi:hypothetical protein
MEKKRINPIFLTLLKHVSPYLSDQELVRLLLVNKSTQKVLKESIEQKRNNYFEIQYTNLIKKQKKKIFVIDNLFEKQALKGLVTTQNFKEINSKNIYEEKILLQKKINPLLRNFDYQKIFKFGNKFYLIIRRCLLDETMNSKLLNKKNRLHKINEKVNYGQVIEEVSKDFEEYDTFLDRKMLLEKHKRLQNRFKDNSNFTKNQTKNSFKVELYNLLHLEKFGILLSTYGDFALSVFDAQKGKEVFHTSDHKYVVRKKNGTKQSKKDKAKKIRSVGSQIRRANEKKHLENIEKIIRNNLKQIQSCKLMLVSAPGDNLIELKSIFEKFDLQGVCFRQLGENVTKAKYSELLKIRTNLLKTTIITF